MLKNEKRALVIVSLMILGLLVFNVTKNHAMHPTSDQELAQTTAMITNLAGNSGGTGVILHSSPSLSQVLTNAHVCGVIKRGGIIHANGQQSLPSSYQISEQHDLCLITVHRNLHVNTEVAENAPELYSPSNVCGHPSLLPSIITRGHFSEKEFITVMTGFRPCTKEEWEGKMGGACFFFGGLPIIKRYEAQVSSSTISPGSSGSAVFDSSGRIAGLVFAGQGNLGYAHIVPLEYVLNFVQHEVKYLQYQIPTEDSMADLEENAGKKLRDVCKEGVINSNYSIAKPYCEYIESDLMYNDDEAS